MSVNSVITTVMWTVDPLVFVDNSKKVATYLVIDLEQYGIDVINHLLHSIVFNVDCGYYVHEKCPSINFPYSLIDDSSAVHSPAINNSFPVSRNDGVSGDRCNNDDGDRYNGDDDAGSREDNKHKNDDISFLSLSCLMFHVCIHKNILQHYFYVSDIHSMIIKEINSRRKPTLSEQALVNVYYMFRDFVELPPLVNRALQVEHRMLRRQMAHAAFMFRMLYPVYTDYERAISRLVGEPWTIWTFTKFCADFRKVMINCRVSTIPIVLLPTGAPMQKRQASVACPPASFIIENNKMGLVCLPEDKLLVASILLFTENHKYTTKPKSLSPPQFHHIIDAYHEYTKHKMNTPSYL